MLTERHNTALARRPERNELAAVPAQPPRWLDELSGNGYGSCPRVPSGMIERDLAHWRALCEPAEIKMIAVLLEETLELFGAPDNWDVLADYYLEALEDVPPDIIRSALKQVRLQCVWFPKPAEIRKFVNDKLNERLSTEYRLERALHKRLEFEAMERKTHERDEAEWLESQAIAQSKDPSLFGIAEWTARLHLNYGLSRDAARTLYLSWLRAADQRRFTEDGNHYPHYNMNRQQKLSLQKKATDDFLRVLRAAHACKPSNIETFLAERLGA